MEYVSGGTLYDLFEKKSNFTENEISSVKQAKNINNKIKLIR